MSWCTADDVVRYAGLTEPDWDLLDALVERACAAIENFCGVAFERASHDEQYDIGPQQAAVVLRHYPVAAVEAVYEGGAESWRQLSADEYSVDAAAGIVRRRSGVFPPGLGTVRVIYTAGYQQAPAPAVQAAVMLAADWYRNRPDGRALREEYDGYAASYAADLLPPQVRQLIEPYRRLKLA